MVKLDELDDPAGVPHDPARLQRVKGRARKRGQKKVGLAMVTAVAVFAVLTGLALVPDGDRDGGVAVAMDPPSTEPQAGADETSPETTRPWPTSTQPQHAVIAPPPTWVQPAVTAPSPTVTQPAPVVMADERWTLAEDAAKGWALTVMTSSEGRCLEFTVSTFSSGPLLCDAAPVAPGSILGDLITFNTPIGRAVVAVVHPSIDGWSTSPYLIRQSKVAPDPVAHRRAYAYAGGLLVAPPPLNGSVTLYLRQGDNTVARSSFAVGEGVVPPGQSITHTAMPYGVWPGYRMAGTTGFFWGGNEEVGFYDGPNGVRCLLYRRLGGDSEAVILDLCAPRSTTESILYAKLLPPDTGMPAGRPVVSDSGILVVLVDGLAVTGWRCEVNPGGVCGGSSGGPMRTPVIHDPAGSGRSMLGNFPGSLKFGDAATVTVFPLDGTRVLAELVLETP